MAYETILTFHIVSFVFNIGLVVVADTIGLLWVLKKINNLPKTVMLGIHRLVWVGLAVSIVTGSVMFWAARDYLLSVPAFYTKLAFVIALTINSFFISRHLKNALLIGSFNNLTSKEKRHFFLSGAISTLSWIVVVISANLLGL